MMQKIILCLAALLFLPGCHAKPAEDPVLPYVTAVDIHYRFPDGQLQRRYIDCRKMDVILYYLYALDPWGQPEEDPEQLQADFCKIKVTLSDGQKRIYRQIGNQYFSADSHRWQRIQESQGSVLLHLLQHIESDEY